MKSVVLIFVLTCFRLLAFTQAACYSSDYKQELIRKTPELALKIAAIESSTKQFIVNRKASNGDSKTPSNDFPLITIPVVVHILYQSSGQNISDAQVISQIDVLNKDYQRLNGDSINTPEIFRPFAASCGFRFVLATTDPQGSPTNGIIRKHTDILAFSIDDRIKSSALGGDDPWNCDNYLNIWVGNLTSGILGYSSVVGGPKDKDGVAIQFTAFGTMGSVLAPFNKGRTATHEIGHWLNLIHTWGDADCGDDQVADTPPQKGPNRGCPSAVRITCGSGPYGDMYMNYMDFTDDACLNIFTADQRDRMRALFAAGGVRSKILSSTAADGVSASRPIDATTSEADGAGLRIYPNPASDRVMIHMSDSASVPLTLGIYNTIGQRLSTIQIYQSHQEINVGSFPRGIYYLHVEGGNKHVVLKLVKM